MMLREPLRASAAPGMYESSSPKSKFSVPSLLLRDGLTKSKKSILGTKSAKCKLVVDEVDKFERGTEKRRVDAVATAAAAAASSDAVMDAGIETNTRDDEKKAEAAAVAAAAPFFFVDVVSIAEAATVGPDEAPLSDWRPAAPSSSSSIGATPSGEDGAAGDVLLWLLPLLKPPLAVAWRAGFVLPLKAVVPPQAAGAREIDVPTLLLAESTVGPQKVGRPPAALLPAARDEWASRGGCVSDAMACAPLVGTRCASAGVEEGEAAAAVAAAATAPIVERGKKNDASVAPAASIIGCGEKTKDDDAAAAVVAAAAPFFVVDVAAVSTAASAPIIEGGKKTEEGEDDDNTAVVAVALGLATTGLMDAAEISRRSSASAISVSSVSIGSAPPVVRAAPPTSTSGSFKMLLVIVVPSSSIARCASWDSRRSGLFKFGIPGTPTLCAEILAEGLSMRPNIWEKVDNVWWQNSGVQARIDALHDVRT
jgi:hypothetical protein